MMWCLAELEEPSGSFSWSGHQRLTHAISFDPHSNPLWQVKSNFDFAEAGKEIQ